jgi:hypothetical protein
MKEENEIQTHLRVAVFCAIAGITEITSVEAGDVK